MHGRLYPHAPEMVEKPGPFLVAEDIVDQNWQRCVLRTDSGDCLKVKIADFRHVAEDPWLIDEFEHDDIGDTLSIQGVDIRGNGNEYRFGVIFRGLIIEPRVAPIFDLGIHRASTGVVEAILRARAAMEIDHHLQIRGLRHLDDRSDGMILRARGL